MTTGVATPTDGRIEEIRRRFSGALSLCARNLVTEEEIAVNADEVCATASVIKLPILVELLRAAADGEVSLDHRRPLQAGDQVGGSGILKVFQPGLDPTLRDLATLMVVVSDNTATNMVLDALGQVDGVNRTMKALGFPTIELHNRVDFELIGGDVRRLGEGSTRDLCALAHGIATRSVVSAEVSEAAEEILEGQQYLDQVARYTLVTPYWRELGQDPVIRAACKTGFFTGTRVDAGIIRFASGGGFAYAVASDRSEDQTFLPEAEGSVVNGLIGKVLVEHWWDTEAGPAATVPTAYDVA
jgi:beta-lactamase class A